MKITEHRHNDRGGLKKTHTIDETKCVPVKEASRAFVADRAEFKAVQTRLRDAEVEPARLKAQAAEAAGEGGRRGADASEAKAILKAARKAQEGLEDLELDYIAIEGKVAASRDAYFDALEAHADELLAEARAEADAALLTLAAGAKMTRDGSASLSAALATMNGLRGVRDGDEFIPRPARAKREGSDDFLLDGAPEVHASVGLDSISTAIDMAGRILRDFAAEAKARALLDGLEAEADDAPDIDDEPDEDDDDDGLDPDLYDVDGEDES